MKARARGGAERWGGGGGQQGRRGVGQAPRLGQGQQGQQRRGALEPLQHSITYSKAERGLGRHQGQGVRGQSGGREGSGMHP